MYRIIFHSSGTQGTTLLTIFLFILFVGLTALTVQQRMYLGKRKVVLIGLVFATVGSFLLGFFFLFNTLIRTSKYVAVTNGGIYISYISGGESVRWEDIDSVQIQKNPISTSMTFFLADKNSVNFDLNYIENVDQLEQIVRQNIKLQEF